MDFQPVQQKQPGQRKKTFKRSILGFLLKTQIFLFPKISNLISYLRYVLKKLRDYLGIFPKWRMVVSSPMSWDTMYEDWLISWRSTLCWQPVGVWLLRIPSDNDSSETPLGTKRAPDSNLTLSKSLQMELHWHWYFEVHWQCLRSLLFIQIVVTFMFLGATQIRLHFIIFFSLSPASQSAIGELGLIQSSQLTPHKRPPLLKWPASRIFFRKSKTFCRNNTKSCNLQYATKSHKMQQSTIFPIDT